MNESCENEHTVTDNQLSQGTTQELAAVHGVGLAQGILVRILSEALGQCGSLSYPDFMVLEVLESRGGRGARLYELCEMTGWEKSRLSHHLARMETRELINRERYGEDGRGLVVRISPKGQAGLILALEATRGELLQGFFSRLSEDQVRVLGELNDAFCAGRGAFDSVGNNTVVVSPRKWPLSAPQRREDH